MRTVIVGAGQAGRRTAEALRGLDPEREILLLGAEEEPPYDRPPLSKEILLGEARPKGLMQREMNAYAAERIDLRLGVRVVAIDPSGRCVTTADGTRIEYDQLVLATGAQARRLKLPGADDPRVMVLRNLDDARVLHAMLRPGLRLAVAGAGLIGLEVAAAAAQLGCAVTVLEMGPRAMVRSMPALIAERVAGWHRAAGMVLHFGCALTAITPQNTGLLLATGQGEIEADLLLVAIGAVADEALARQAGIAVADGILVDAHGRTGTPNIFAAGEVASIRQPDGRHVRFESWQVAQQQPLAVANAICGIDKPYAELPWHWTDQHGHNVQVFGAHEPGFDWIERDDGAGRFAALGLDAEGRVRGAVLIDNGRDATPVRRIIAGGQRIDRERLSDVSVGLRLLC
jgi:anthranilate 1,2-dioxygenase ferredoxin reductase subunit